MVACLAGWVFIASASERKDVPEINSSPTPTELQLTPIPNLDDLVTHAPVPTSNIKTFRLILPNQPTSPPPTAPAKPAPPTGVPTLLQATLAPINTPTERPSAVPSPVNLTPQPTRSTVNMPPRLHTSGS